MVLYRRRTRQGIVFWEHSVDSARIFDTTLRDGEQSPGTSFSLDDKIRIAEKLDEMGIHVIEAGFPINSDEEFEAVERIAERCDTTVCGLGRVNEPDLDAALDADVDLVHTFVSTSDIQIQKSMDSSREEVLEMTRNAVEHVKDHGVDCMFSPMDATRTDFDYLVDVVRTAKEAGADIVNIPDTVGVIRPTAMHRLISALRDEVDVPYDVHTHDDFGLAAANALAGIEAGAVQCQVSVNGIGERAGNAALEEVVMSLESIYDIDTGIDTTQIYDLSKTVERLSGIPLPQNKPIVGSNAFSHESGIHAAGVINDSSTFEPGIMGPEDVGHKRRLVVGKHTGTHSVREVLEDAGYEPDDDEVKEITKRIKSMGGKGKRVTDADVFAVAESVMSSVPESEQIVDLKEVNVSTGNDSTPMASIRAEVDDEERVDAGVGVGPVDAALNAVRSVMDAEGDDGREIEITDFHIDSISGGSDAVANVYVGVTDGEGREANANASSEDITVASVEALVDAINHLVRKGDADKKVSSKEMV
ncbi:MAG: 2-isopropylmalate synthase [Halobacteria archaeon]|nr:2-isopropylmalate synthase [Halobacteria archaeon]